MIHIVLWAIALFFAASWLFGLLIRQDLRLKSNVVTVAYWWVEIAIVFFAGLHPAHLLWLMPLALIVPSLIMTNLLLSGHNTVGTIFVASGFVIGPALALLLYFTG